MAKHNSEMQQEGKERRSQDFLFWRLSNRGERSHVQNLFSLKILFDNTCGITFQREHVIKY